MTCHCDEEDIGEVYKNCCIEYGKFEDCRFANDLIAAGKGRNDCIHWRGDKEARRSEILNLIHYNPDFVVNLILQLEEKL